jgi:hypothetical protein
MGESEDSVYDKYIWVEGNIKRKMIIYKQKIRRKII